MSRNSTRTRTLGTGQRPASTRRLIPPHWSAGTSSSVAAAIKDIDRECLHRKYHAIDGESYQGELSDSDFEYTWSWFAELRDFFQKAAAANRAMVFTVDQ
jgi:hypothetical protein